MKKVTASLGPERKLEAVIEEDTKVGFYLFVHGEEHGATFARDHFCDTLPDAFRFAHRHYGIPEGAWGSAAKDLPSNGT